MFTTFVGVPNQKASKRAGPKQRRQQVARACAPCRRSRTKCDSNLPCISCLEKTVTCTYAETEASVSARADNLPNVTRLVASSPLLPCSTALADNAFPSSEVTALRTQVNELKSRIAAHFPSDFHQSPDPSNRPLAAVPRVLNNLMPSHQGGSPRRPDSAPPTNNHDESPNRGNEDRNLASAEFHGPLSQVHFAMHLKKHLHRDPYIWTQLVGCSFELATLDQKDHKSSSSTIVAEAAVQEPAPPATETLSRSQQEYYIRQFWQVHLCFMPILDENDFRVHFESLWFQRTEPWLTRTSSHLVDMVLAVGLQFDANNNQRQTGVHQVDRLDSSCTALAGWHYRRAQVSLLNVIWDRSLSSIQLAIIAVLYLENASLTSQAYNALGLIVRAAHTLGLQLHPSAALSQTEQDYRRSLWWSIYALDAQFSITLGRPWAIHVNYQLNFNKENLGTSVSSSPHESAWTSFHIHRTSLFAAARTVQTSIDSRQSSSKLGLPRLAESEGVARKDALEQMNKCIEPFQSWRKKLPETLITARRGGKPFSTDQSPIAPDYHSPSWLQRQRIMLELFYHNLMMIFYRILTTVDGLSTGLDELQEALAKSCRDHATATIVMLYQLYTETDLVNSFAEVYRILWNATLSVVGFPFLVPSADLTQDTQRVLTLSQKTFGMIPHRSSRHATDFLHTFILSQRLGSSTDSTDGPDSSLSENAGVDTPRSMRCGQELSSDCAMQMFDDSYAIDKFLERDMFDWNGGAEEYC